MNLCVSEGPEFRTGQFSHVPILSEYIQVENKLPQNMVTPSVTPPASSETKSVPIQKPPPVAAPRAASTKLFGSLDDDEDDLFSTLTTKSSEKSKVKKDG